MQDTQAGLHRMVHKGFCLNAHSHANNVSCVTALPVRPHESDCYMKSGGWDCRLVLLAL